MLPVFLTEAQKKLQKEAQDFVKSFPRQIIMDMDADKITFPKEFIRECGKRNLLGLRFPKKYGGRELGMVEDLLVNSEMYTLSISFNCWYAVVSIVGECLNGFGTEAQKEKYLRPIIAGEKWGALSLTEPRGGSDFFGATTTATKKGNTYYLNGQKRFTVGAEGADFFLVYAMTGSKGGKNTLGLFIVDREMGVEVKHVYGMMGARGSGTGRLIFHDVPVPTENLIASEDSGEEIFNRMINVERIGANGTQNTRALLAMAARYANKRKAFGQRIRNFEGVSFKIAESITKLDAASCLAYAAAKSMDDGIGDQSYQRRLCSEVKKYVTTVNWEVINDVMQILGGIGYTNVFPVERALRESRLAMIWSGTNEVMNVVIQHEYYRELLQTGVTGRDMEKDVPLTEEEAAAEKIYE
ncbi:MAG: acyl-CoA dehydrogenase family protein [Smithellaceae bacterium]